MIRYYCSGFDKNNAFGHGLGDMFKEDLKDMKRIVYIPGGPHKVEKAISKSVPEFIEHFEKVGIKFDESIIITPDMSKEDAKSYVESASFIMLMGGDPFKQREMCEELEILDSIKNSKAVILGFSAGAMLMSKYTIITPCSDEYPDFHIEDGLNLDGISIYPHNNTESYEYPDSLDIGGEVYQKNDLIKVAGGYGNYYLLQDYTDDGITFDVSLIRVKDGNMEFHTENNGKIWVAAPDEVQLEYPKTKKTLFKTIYIYVILTLVISMEKKLIIKNDRNNPIIKFWNWGWNIYYKNPEIWNYLIVGILTTIVSLGIKYALLFTIFDASNPIELQTSVIISWIGAVMFAYVTNRVFVFKSKEKNIVKEIFNFTLGRIATLLIEMFIMWFICTLLSLNSNVWVIIATIICQVMQIVGNYVISKLFVFKKSLD